MMKQHMDTRYRYDVQILICIHIKTLPWISFLFTSVSDLIPLLLCIIIQLFYGHLMSWVSYLHSSPVHIRDPTYIISSHIISYHIIYITLSESTILWVSDSSVHDYSCYKNCVQTGCTELSGVVCRMHDSRDR